MVEGTTLEMWHGGNPIGGSNPPASARQKETAVWRSLFVLCCWGGRFEARSDVTLVGVTARAGAQNRDAAAAAIESGGRILPLPPSVAEATFGGHSPPGRREGDFRVQVASNPIFYMGYFVV